MNGRPDYDITLYGEADAWYRFLIICFAEDVNALDQYLLTEPNFDVQEMMEFAVDNNCHAIVGKLELMF